MSHTKHNLHSITNEIDTLLKSDKFITGLYQSTENICGILSAIIKTRGEKWIDHVPGLTDEEKHKMNALCSPYIPQVLAFFNKMSGGEVKDEVKEDAKDAAVPSPAENVVDDAKDAIDAVKNSAKKEPKSKPIHGPDNFFEKIVAL